MFVGDKVLRKNGKGKIGKIERIYSGGKVYVRWENVLRPFSGGYSDNHSQISISALIPAADENIRRQRLKLARNNLTVLEQRARQRYCSIHKCNCGETGSALRCCYCNRELMEEETFPSTEVQRQIERVRVLIVELS